MEKAIMFAKYDDQGNLVRNIVVIDCSSDEPLTEQSHKSEVNINNIVKRHGMDLIAKTALLKTPEYVFDDVTGNDFTEAMLKVTKAQQQFDAMPSQIRKKFDNSAAQFMDFVQNPDNTDALIDMGLAKRVPPEQPIQVEVITPPTPNPETPPE